MQLMYRVYNSDSFLCTVIFLLFHNFSSDIKPLNAFTMQTEIFVLQSE